MDRQSDNDYNNRGQQRQDNWRTGRQRRRSVDEVQEDEEALGPQSEDSSEEDPSEGGLITGLEHRMQNMRLNDSPLSSPQLSGTSSLRASGTMSVPPPVSSPSRPTQQTSSDWPTFERFSQRPQMSPPMPELPSFRSQRAPERSSSSESESEDSSNRDSCSPSPPLGGRHRASRPLGLKLHGLTLGQSSSRSRPGGQASNWPEEFDRPIGLSGRSSTAPSFRSRGSYRSDNSREDSVSRPTSPLSPIQTRPDRPLGRSLFPPRSESQPPIGQSSSESHFVGSKRTRSESDESSPEDSNKRSQLNRSPDSQSPVSEFSSESDPEDYGSKRKRSPSPRADTSSESDGEEESRKKYGKRTGALPKRGKR